MSNDQKSAKFLAQIGLACLQIGNKSPCLFTYHSQISLPICVSSQISLPICVSSTNLPAYLCQKFCLFLLIRPVISILECDIAWEKKVIKKKRLLTFIFHFFSNLLFKKMLCNLSAICYIDQYTENFNKSNFIINTVDIIFSRHQNTNIFIQITAFYPQEISSEFDKHDAYYRI